jgi:hypothetical protein
MMPSVVKNENSLIKGDRPLFSNKMNNKISNLMASPVIKSYSAIFASPNMASPKMKTAIEPMFGK